MAPKAVTNPITAIEAELGNLAARRSTLEERRAKAATALDAARTARKTALATDPAADLSKLTATVRDGEDELATIDGVLDDLAEQEADADRRLAVIQDRNERAAAAKTLIGVAGTVDMAAAELDKAISALAKAADLMAAAIPDTLHVVEVDEKPFDGQTIGERLVSIIVAEGLAAAAPSLVPLRHWADHGNAHVADLRRGFRLDGDRIVMSGNTDDLKPDALDTAAATRVVITDRIRARAEAIAAGALSADLADVAPVVPAIVESSYVEIIATQGFKYRLTETDFVADVDADTVTKIPADVAAMAKKHGVAVRTDTTEGAQAIADADERRERRKRPASALGVAVFPALKPRQLLDLGVIRPSADAALDAA